MKEIINIVKAYKEAKTQNLRCALATVVKVEGSSYRQPGARMLIDENGILTGAISGGCLEGDALKKALLTIHQKKNKLITYDTSNPEDTAFGVQLGCNGIVHILFEYIDEAIPMNPIFLLEKVIDRREPSVLVTFFSLENRAQQMGTALVFQENKYLTVFNSLDIENKLKENIDFSIETQQSVIAKTNYNEQVQDALIEYIPIPILLVIVGAGNDVIPLVNLAQIMGWDTTIVDGRLSHANKNRFPTVDNIIVCTSEDVISSIELDKNTAIVLMTHNYKYDRTVLEDLLKSNVAYIGSLGPKTKLDRMIEEIEKEGTLITPEQKRKLYGPVGLDIGAETSEEIALSIVSEIAARFNGKKGQSLKFKEDKIHLPTIEINS